MNQRLINIVLATLIVVAIGVAIFRSPKLSDGDIQKIVDSIQLQLGAIGTRFPNGLAAGGDGTTVVPTGALIASSTNQSKAFQVTGGSRLYGTTTPDQLLFPVGGALGFTATGTAITLYSNTTGPKLCTGGTGALSLRNTGSFSPSVVVSVGTSTASVTTTNLIASTTVATSTPGTSFFNTVSFTDSDFVLQQGDELMAIVGDITNTSASSTYFTNLTLDARLLCSEIAI